MVPPLFDGFLFKQLWHSWKWYTDLILFACTAISFESFQMKYSVPMCVIIWNKILKADINSDTSKLSAKIMLKGAIQQDVITMQSQEMNKNLFTLRLTRNCTALPALVVCWIWIMNLIIESINPLGSLANIFPIICSMICYWCSLMCFYHFNDDVPRCCVQYIVYIMVKKAL